VQGKPGGVRRKIASVKERVVTRFEKPKGKKNHVYKGETRGTTA